MNTRWRWLAVVGALIAVGIGLAIAKPWAGDAPEMTAEAAKQAVIARYPGTVEKIERSDGSFVVDLRTEQGLYRITANARDGEIVYLERLEAASSNDPGGEATPAPTGPDETPSPEPTDSGPGKGTDRPSVLIGEAKAMELAAAHVEGQAEEAELKGATGSEAYYLVEVEVERGSDAVVQVNALSGEIMSVTWDDDDKDDRDDGESADSRNDD